MYLEVSCVLECSGTELDSTNELIAHVYEQKARPTEYKEKKQGTTMKREKNQKHLQKGKEQDQRKLLVAQRRRKSNT